VKQYRRIQITAFRRRVFITSGGPEDERSESAVSILGDDSDETIEAGSEDGQKIIAETVRLLEEKLVEFSNTIETPSATDRET